MDDIEEFIDDRLKGFCIYCGTSLDPLETSLDHVPSKSLLQRPRPPHLPVVKVCKPCNNGFSLDEQYFVAFLGSVLAGSTEPEAQHNESAKRALSRSEKLKSRIERSKTTYRTHGGDTHFVWKPESERIHRIIVKNARGHAFFEHGEPILTKPSYVWSAPLESLSKAEVTEFECVPSRSSVMPLSGWPEVGSRMLTRVVTGQDLSGSWVVVQDGVYRYCFVDQNPLHIRTILYEYLATEVIWNN